MVKGLHIDVHCSLRAFVSILHMFANIAARIPAYTPDNLAWATAYWVKTKKLTELVRAMKFAVETSEEGSSR